MNSMMLRALAKVAVGVICVLAISTTSVGCACKRCGPCASAKKCPPGCTKPCCKKADAPSGG